MHRLFSCQCPFHISFYILGLWACPNGHRHLKNLNFFDRGPCCSLLLLVVRFQAKYKKNLLFGNFIYFKTFKDLYVSNGFQWPSWFHSYTLMITKSTSKRENGPNLMGIGRVSKSERSKAWDSRSKFVSSTPSHASNFSTPDNKSIK